MRRRNELLTVAFLLAAFWAAPGSEAQTDDGGALMPAIPAFRTSALEASPKLELSVEPPQVPDSLPVFEIVPGKPPEEALREAARAVGIELGAVRSEDGKLALHQGSKEPGQGSSLALFEASGGFFFMVDRLFSPPAEQPSLPEDERAHALAVEYLKERGLLPEDALAGYETAELVRSTLVEFDGESGRDRRRVDVSVEVRLPQSWDGYRVTGPGSKLYVALGDGGEVLGVTRMWRQARRSEAKLPSIPPKESLELLAEGRGRQAYPTGCARAAVERLELAYWSASPRLPQRTALPVYRLRGTCTSAEGVDLGEFEAYAPAVRDVGFQIPQRSTRDVHEDEDDDEEGPEG